MTKIAALVVVVAAIPVATAAAGRSSNLNACSVVTAKQASSLGVTRPCVAKTIPGLSGVISAANWGTPGSDPAALALTVTTFKNTHNTAWQTNMKILKLLSGNWKKVSGIGSIAYESGGNGGTQPSIRFVKGKRIVAFSWYSNKPQTSLKTFTAIAKSIAAQI